MTFGDDMTATTAPASSGAGPPRIVDEVFGSGRGARRRRRGALAVTLGIGVHIAAVLWALGSAPSLETWSAELATRVHAELTREEVIDLPPPPPPPEKPPDKPAPPAPPPPSIRPVVRVHRQAAPPPSPAQAGQIVAATPTAPIDLPGTTFVTGSGTHYAGGTTSSTGKSQVAVTGPVSPKGPPLTAPATARDESSPVAIDETNWTCPWPAEADSREINEESVVIQVVVRADGRAESVKIVSDPGYGFAAATRSCALSTRFQPAHDRDGRSVRAQSPPIRVHFSR